MQENPCARPQCCTKGPGATRDRQSLEGLLDIHESTYTYICQRKQTKQMNNICIYISIYIFICESMYIYIYIHTYMHGERRFIHTYVKNTCTYMIASPKEAGRLKGPTEAPQSSLGLLYGPCQGPTSPYWFGLSPFAQALDPYLGYARGLTRSANYWGVLGLGIGCM